MHVTIVIPAHNAASTIGETLLSVFEQSTGAWQAVVVDDGSTDATASIARSMGLRDRRLAVIRQEQGGEAAARNAGIRRARHDWLLFLDADDWIARRHMETMTAQLAADRSLDAVLCGYARVAADGTTTVEPYQPPAGDLFPTLARRAAFPVHACIVRRSLVEDVGLFDPSLETSPDWDLWQRVARAGANFGSVPDVLAFYRMSARGRSLEAVQLCRDGLRILRQGLAPDARVPRPAPRHANGTAEPMHTQQYYLLTWCAGLLLGANQDPAPLFQLVDHEPFEALYAPAIGQCLFDSVPLPSCQPPTAWNTLWPALQPRLNLFLTELERRATAPGLAADAQLSLRARIAALENASQPALSPTRSRGQW